MTTVQDCYRILGVHRGASDDDIKRAYYERAREHHPDRTAGSADATARFRECRSAYEVLRDPARRAAHDRGLDQARPRRPGGGTARSVRRAPRRRLRRRRPAAIARVLDALFASLMAEAGAVASAILDDLLAQPRWDRRSRRWRDREGRFVTG